MSQPKRITAPLADPSRRRPVSEDLRRIWERRDFLVFAAGSDLRTQEMDTVLGNLWHLINPALQILVYYIVFGLILATNRGVENFLPFLAIGIFSYSYMRKVIMGGAKTLLKNRGLIHSISAPRAIFPIAVMLTEAAAFAFPFGVMLVVAIVTGESISPMWLLMAPVFVLQSMFAVGMGFIAARITFYFRDFEHVMEFLFRMAFYFSGVLFYVDKFVKNPTARQIADLNPLLDYISLYRWVVLGLPVGKRLVLSAIAWSVAAPVVGYLWFQRRERDYGRE
jgi:teichoic acid transport system permease protein